MRLYMLRSASTDPEVASLLIDAAQVGSALDQDLSATLLNCYGRNAQRFALDSEFAKRWPR